MNWDRVEGSWKQFKGGARRRWSRLTGRDVDAVARKASEKQLAEWLARAHETDPIHK